MDFPGKASASPAPDADGDGVRTTACRPARTDSADGAQFGSAGGAPATTGDFSWMCSGNQHICGPGQPGVFYPHLEYGYQCVWYAWNRLAMIHGNTGWSWLMGNGGEIKDVAARTPGWTVDDSPRPGDGISGNTAPFSGPPPGHVAVVEEVQPDPSGWRIRISEGNRNGSATFDTYGGNRWITRAQIGDARFFRNNAWK